MITHTEADAEQAAFDWLVQAAEWSVGEALSDIRSRNGGI